PAWSKMAQREKEEELIFRGLQYAEAIRVFQRKFGRYPTRLEELIEVEPRKISSSSFSRCAIFDHAGIAAANSTLITVTMIVRITRL
ncbi:MAG TPA: hypothetical protein VHQ65_00740, partial [Thermoanaerobaculia bacterium]|nr:hypothetical protein [Thermoanaerobaculia bacterium]